MGLVEGALVFLSIWILGSVSFYFGPYTRQYSRRTKTVIILVAGILGLLLILSG